MMQKHGFLANATGGALNVTACVVCDDPHPAYSWTDYSGEGICLRCGTSYQLKWGELREGETYPRPNVRADAIPMLRRYWQETGKRNGCGTIMCEDEYPEIAEGRRNMADWWQEHKDEYPELATSTADRR